MFFFDWLLSIRKKPLEERRRFAALFTVVVTACLTAAWLLLTVTFGPLKFDDSAKEKSVATPINLTLPELPPFPELPDMSKLKK